MSGVAGIRILIVIPAYAGIQLLLLPGGQRLDPDVRRDDENKASWRWAFDQ